MPNKFRNNSFTPRQHRVLGQLHTLFQDMLPTTSRPDSVREITEVLREVIDSANPDADNAPAH